MKRCLKGILLMAASLGLVTLAVCALQRAPAQEEGQGTVPDGGHHERAENSAAAAFDGRIVALAIHGASSPKLLAEARFEEVGGRTFLVGREVKSMSNIPVNVDAHLAWNSVDAFYLFDSVEQYETALNRALEEAHTNVVPSVQVRIIDPANRLNGHGDQLAAALMKRIEETTPMRVCASNADTILTCTISADSAAPAQNSPYSRAPLEAASSIAVEWTDLDGDLLQPGASVSLPEIARLPKLFPEIEEGMTTEQRKSILSLAARIVQVLEESW